MASRLWPRGRALLPLRNESPARDCCRTQQPFLPALPARPKGTTRQARGIAPEIAAASARLTALRLVIQRVRSARVTVEGRVSGEIGEGIVVLLGAGKEDTSEAAAHLAQKTAELRIFNDAQGKMNLSLLDVKGAALVVSQFTLYGDVRRGRRPGFDRAAPAEVARRLYEEYVAQLRKLGVPAETGVFQAHMQVELINDGPVTILMDSEKAI